MDGNIVWVSPPYRGSINDKTIFRQGLHHHLPEGYLAIVDKGYSGRKFAPISELDSQEVIFFKKRVLSRHETVNKRIKDFSVTSTKFRHGVAYHDACFHAVATICQYSIETDEPLFDL